MTGAPAKDLREFYEHAYERAAAAAPLVEEHDFMYGQVIGEIKGYLRANVRALDLGCNDGALSLFMAGRGCRVLGVDLAENAVETARAGAEHHGVSGAEFRQLDFVRDWSETQVFDLVLCSHVIEHVPDDEAFLRRVCSSLKPGATLVLFTPTLHSLLYRSYKALGRPFPFDEEVGHLRRYDKAALTALAERAGFAVERLAYLDSPLRELCIIPKPLRKLQRVLSLPGVRSAFNALDRLVAKAICPATICIHAKRAQ